MQPTGHSFVHPVQEIPQSESDYLITVGHVDGRHALGVPRRHSVADILRKERRQGVFPKCKYHCISHGNNLV